MATIKDVAKKSGVSIMTVSRVINNTSYVKKETREKVLKTIKELNYHPNSIGRGLRNKKINVIGLIATINPAVKMINNSYYYRLQRGIENACIDFSFDLMICTSLMKHPDKDFLSLYHQGKVDGLIFLGVKVDEEMQKKIISSSIPAVFVNNVYNNNSIDYVDCENTKCIIDLVDRICKLGHHKIGFMKVDESNPNLDERFSAYRKALEINGIKYNEDYVLVSNYFEEKSIEVTKKMLNKKDLPSAIICATDRMAVGALKAIKEFGLNIPENMSIVGFDGDENGRNMTPSLTTFIQPLEEMGYEAANFLFNRINNPDIKLQKKIFDVDFEKGESLGNCPQ